MAKILAVDDSASMRSMVAFTLRGAGHDVDEADNGQVAVMDGISMVREMRTMAGYSGVPILMLTTESNPEKKMEGKAAGATGWLVKPFDPDQLLATVARVLG
jgi:two-component system chemotaxis response regulator CheY